MTTIAQAVDDIHARFKAAWDTVEHAVVYTDVPLSTAAEAATNPESATLVPWARVTLRHNTRTQGTLVGVGGRRFDVRGVFTVEIYTPSGDGLTLARTLSRLVEQAFEGVSTPNGVWFRNTRTNEVGPDGPWFHVNVITEFLYDEVR